MLKNLNNGGVAEWTIAPVLKTGVSARVPEVRILSPPKIFIKIMDLNKPKIKPAPRNNLPAEIGKNDSPRRSESEAGEPFFSWEAPEYEHFEKHPKWYWVMGAVLLAIVVYALITNAILMAITFILIGMLGYIYAEREPRVIKMEIIPDGIRADNYFYDYNDVRSFWIFYEVEEAIRF